MFETIAPRSGVAFLLKAGERLVVKDPEGQQVSDLFCFNAQDLAEKLSSARSMDEAESILLSTGNTLFSNRGNPLLTIVQDNCGRHDFLLPPCRELENGHPGCQENLAQALRSYGVSVDQLSVAFNVFMHVEVTSEGRLVIHPPHSEAGDEVVFEASMDLIVALTACAHLETNGGVCKPIQWEIQP